MKETPVKNHLQIQNNNKSLPHSSYSKYTGYNYFTHHHDNKLCQASAKRAFFANKRKAKSKKTEIQIRLLKQIQPPEPEKKGYPFPLPQEL